MTNFHAKLSPSGAHRWIPCVGSLSKESKYPDTSSEFADEGTLAHALAAHALENENDAALYVGDGFEYDDHGERKEATITTDMAREVQKYLDAVRELAGADGELMVEQRLPIFSTMLPPLPVDTYGTSDAVVIHAERRRLTVGDLKYGRGVQVWAEENPQLMLYALGALDEFGMLYDFDEVAMVIYQPRLDHVDEWVCSVEHLRAFEKVAYEAGKTALAIVDNGPGTVFLNPGEKQCKFCKAKGDCPALRDQVLATVALDFEPLTDEELELADSLGAEVEPVIDQLAKGEVAVSIAEAERVLAAAYGVAPKAVDFEATEPAGADDPSYLFPARFVIKKPTLRPALENAEEKLAAVDEAHLAMCMDSVDLVEGWCKAVRAEVERRMLAGTPVPGWKLVTGKQGNRAWVDEAKAVEMLKSMRLKNDVMYDWKVISPTTAESLHAAGVIKPRQWDKLQDIIARANGKPSVAPASDKRPALQIGRVEDDFDALDDDSANDII